VVIINRGKVVAMDTPTGLTNQMKGAEKVALTVAGPKSEVVDRLKAIDGVLDVKSDGDGNDGPVNYTVECRLQSDLRSMLAREIVSQGWGLLELRGVSMSLEDVFINLVTQE
jgi:ABC-2 type transport system ATP-binding protein